jgi:subtilase family protein
VALTAIAALVAAPAAAPAAGLRQGTALQPTVTLPGAAAAAGVGADGRTWIVGVRPGRPAAIRIARAHGARPIAGTAWLVARERAGALAAALRARGLLAYAQPNRISVRAQAPAPDPLSAQAAWRDVVVGGQIPPPVTPASPLIALVDSQLDPSHPEIQGSNIATAGGRPLVDFHGTATATVAAAPANGVGILGVWPGAHALNLPMPTEISCSDSARTIAAAIKAKAAVINMSYGSRSACLPEYEQVERAVRTGIVPVAAAGNEFDQGNPLEFPASLPHVLTIAAIGTDDKATSFSSRSAAIDLSAPGEGILTAVPVSTSKDLDPDLNGDGYALLDGTSFSAPMVSAAVAWVRATRPGLTPDQVAQVIRLGARDVGRRGYESDTGFGVLSLAGALARTPPVADPLEPNDSFRFVNGKAFSKPATPIFFGRKPVTLTALTDAYEDPTDIYRVKIPAHKRIRLTITPAFGDPDLYLYDRHATRFSQTRQILARSRRRGSKVDSVSFRNRTGRTLSVFAAIGIDGKVKQLDAQYTLTIARR